MFFKPFGAAVFVFFACTLALSQDPTKVEAKHYTLAFENETVQVINVHYGPHEKSELHSHPGGVVVVLTGGHLKFTDEKGVSREVFAKPGESRWFPPFRHKVENLGDTPYNAVYVGLKIKRTEAGANSKAGQPKMDAKTKKFVADYMLALAKH